ncbi:hypothetical protein Tco_0225641, partial [Tanacetum coccineum]
MSPDLRARLARWCDLNIPEISNLSEWISWLDSCQVTKKARFDFFGVQTTTTFDAFPSNIPTLSPATCRWGNLSPAKCRWGKVDGVSSMAKRSPATIPSEKWAPRIFWSRNWCHGGSRFPSDMSLGKIPFEFDFSTLFTSRVLSFSGIFPSDMSLGK